MFPELDPFEIERMRRFAEARSFAQGEAIFTAGQVGQGLVVILSGEVDIVRHEFSRQSLIVMHGPGQFMGESAQLAGRPALVDAVATKPVQALIIAPERLRALLIAEAELGERIMRALILRRVGLLETGVGGPIIVGRADNAMCSGFRAFSVATVIRINMLDSETDDEAKALIERFHRSRATADRALPRRTNAAKSQRARACALCRFGSAHRSGARLSRCRCGSRTRRSCHRSLCRVGRTLRPRARLPSLWRSGRRLGSDRKLLGFPTGITGIALMARAYNQAQKFGAEMAIPDEVSALHAQTDGAGNFTLQLSNGERVSTRAVVIASGARYRRPRC